MIDAQPTPFDYDTTPDPPEWLVDGVLERGTVVALTGDTGSGKSFLAMALTVAVASGGEWLGRPVKRGRALYVDAEMARRLARDRLAAFGMTNQRRERVAYYSRPRGVLLGEPAANRWLIDAAKAHRADLVVIDTATSATCIDLNSNAEVAGLYRDVLRPVADTGAVVLVALHERKAAFDEQGARSLRTRSQATLGARSWIGQADMALSVDTASELVNDPLPAGRSRQRLLLDLAIPKLRDGVPASASRLALISERDAEGVLDNLILEPRDGAAKITPEDRIVACLTQHGTMRRGELAEMLGYDSSKSTALDRALKRLLTDERVVQPQYGVWAASSGLPSF